MGEVKTLKEWRELKGMSREDLAGKREEVNQSPDSGDSLGNPTDDRWEMEVTRTPASEQSKTQGKQPNSALLSYPR